MKPSKLDRLPQVYEDYMAWRQKIRRTKDARRLRIQSILGDFHVWLKDHHIDPDALKIEHVDAFLKIRSQGLAPWTRADTRGIVKDFLRYLYLEKKMLTRDLAAMIVAAPVFNYEIPPKYLRKNATVSFCGWIVILSFDREAWGSTFSRAFDYSIHIIRSDYASICCR